MAYTLKIGSFAKHENSTAQPNTTGWTEYSVTLKNGVDLSAPILEIATDMTTIAAFNYAEFLGRFYWIRLKNMQRAGYCVLTLDIDVLATYKTAIGAANLYILRSSTASDGSIRDTYYPMDGETTKAQYIISAGVLAPFSSGVYVVNVMGMQTGSSTLYQFTPAQFTELIQKLMVVANGYDPSDPVDAILLGIFKPMEYINSVMWFPEAFDAVSVSASNFYIGYWPGNVACSQITNPIKHLNSGAAYTPVVYKHPQAATRGEYLNYAPYTEYNIDFPPFGIIPLDTTQLKDETYISLDLYVDALTGMGILRGKTINNPAIIFEVNAQYGVQLPLLSNPAGGSVAGMLSTAVGIGTAVATGGAAAMAGAITAGIGTLEDAIIGTTCTVGSNGSVVAHSLPKYLNARFFSVVPEDNARNGRPYCRVTTPAALGGYMIAQKGDVDIAAPLPELQKITSFLESGFYYE